MFDITKLKSNVEDTLLINQYIEIPESLIKKTDIQRLNDIKLTGRISRIDNDIYHLELNIKGNMVLLCARSLEEVNHPFDITIDENLGIEDEENKIFQNSLDILSIVWENIVLEVPLRVIKEDAKILSKGDGWSFNEELKDSSPLSELKTLLDMEGKE